MRYTSDQPSRFFEDARLSWWRPITVLLVASVLMAACGGGGDQGTANRAAEPVSEAPSRPDEKGRGSAFPRTIEHKFGSTEIPAEPTRVVSVGSNDQDAILAVGVKPVAVTYWYGDHPFATFPWAQDELGDSQPEVLERGELNFEQITALRPDLIIGLFSGMTVQEYETLSQIAPTVPQSGDYPDYAMPWDEAALMVGRALGREARAEQAVADVKAGFAQARDDHPEFQGVEAIGGQLGKDPSQYYLGGPGDARVQFLSNLGFELPAEIAELVGDASNAEISAEQLSLVDTADLVLWPVGQARELATQVQEDPIYQQLEVVQRGADVFVLPPEGEALSWNTVLSLPFALEGIVPLLAAAVDGDPTTRVATGA